MTERRIQAIKAGVIGKFFDEVDFILKQEGYLDVDSFKTDLGYEVTYYRQYSGTFTVTFDWEHECQTVYYRY